MKPDDEPLIMGIAVVFFILSLLFAKACHSHEPNAPLHIHANSAEIEEVKINTGPTMSEVAAMCAAMTGVVYNQKTGVVSFTPNHFWEQFTTDQAIVEIQFEVMMSIRIDPTTIDIFLDGAEKCEILKRATLSEIVDE